MKKIFQCEKCGEKFDSAEECLQHERQCKKPLKEEIQRVLYEYGIIITNIDEIGKTNDTYIIPLKLMLQSGYALNIDLPSTIDESEVEDTLIKAIKDYAGQNFEGEFENISALCNGFNTYCLNGFDMNLIGKLYEGHQVRLEILD